MAIDYSQRPAGTSKREWTAIQTGQPMPYAKSTPSIYSGQNVVSAISSPYNRPDYSNVSNIYASLNKSIENLNKYDEQLAKGQATIAKRRIGLTPMGRQADEAARIGAIGRTGYANQVESYTGALNAAKDAYNMAMTQYNADRDYALKARSAANEMLPGQSVASMAISKAEQALGVKANENWGAVSNWLQANNYDLTQGGEIDNELRRRNQLPPIQSAENVKPLTQAQFTVAGYAKRASDAHQALNNYDELGSQPIAYISGGKYFPNILKTSERQQMEQAQRNFVNAILRRESGAVIAESEFENARQQYFPQPGDQPAVIEQKRLNRETVINNLVAASGSAYNGGVIYTGEQDINDILSQYNL